MHIMLCLCQLGRNHQVKFLRFMSYNCFIHQYIFTFHRGEKLGQTEGALFVQHVVVWTKMVKVSRSTITQKKDFLFHKGEMPRKVVVKFNIKLIEISNTKAQDNRQKSTPNVSPMHPAGRAFPSGWSTNSLMAVIYEKTLLVLLWIEKCSHRLPL